MSLNSTDTKEIRKFGLVALIFFGCLCVLGVWLKKPVPTYLGGVLSMLGLGFILAPAPLSILSGNHPIRYNKAVYWGTSSAC